MKHLYGFKALGKFLREQRVKKKISQVQIAKACGFSSQFVHNWEKGLCAPPPYALLKIVRMLEISEHVILKVILAEQRRFWEAQLNIKKFSSRGS